MLSTSCEENARRIFFDSASYTWCPDQRKCAKNSETAWLTSRCIRGQVCYSSRNTSRRGAKASRAWRPCTRSTHGN